MNMRISFSHRDLRLLMDTYGCDIKCMTKVTLKFPCYCYLSVTSAPKGLQQTR